MNEVVKHADITITIGLNAENVPVSMQWQAPDGPATGAQDCKAMLLSLFSRDELDTLKIDLWTQDMQVVEMDRFFFQTLRALADTYYKATQNAQLAGDMQRFVQYFGEQTEILPPANPG
ncbi:MAG TPA: gliding motility protein GldC [Saprospiraceae bacterium]|nr:gliding motility protein GldC [Saprospiraceae bacterium]HMP25548.1 gliding motility protein GldC [Saprospiraceae bacterium]